MIETTKNTKIAIILLVLPVFMISLFFLYQVNIIIQIGGAVIVLIALYFFMRNITPNNNNKARITTFIIVFSTFGLLYLSNYEVYNLSYPVMYRAMDEESYEMAREHFWYSEYLYFDYTGPYLTDQKAVLINPDDGNNIYLYQLSREIYEMENEITTDEPVSDIFLYDDTPYFTIISDDGTNITTTIYKLDPSRITYEESYQFDGAWDVYGGMDEIILTRTNYALNKTDIIVFDGTTQIEYSVNMRVQNMHSVGPEWFVFSELYTPGRKDWIVFRSFTNELSVDEIITDDIDNVTFQTGFEHLVINGEGDNILYNFYDQTIHHFERPIHYNGDGLYLSGDKIYDLNLEPVGEMLYYDLNGYVAGENRMFMDSNISRAIVFDNERMVEIMAIGREPGIVIPAPYKHILLVFSLLLASFILPYGYKRKPLIYSKERMYIVDKIICPKCKSYNNYITFPDTCDFCGNTDFKQNTT